MSTFPPKDAREIYLDEKTGEPIAYCPKEGIGAVDIIRAQFYNLNQVRLWQLSKRAKEKIGETGIIQCVVCIDVDDASWTPLVEHLMPGHDWNIYRARGEQPIARGVVPLEPIKAMVDEFYPAASDEFAGDKVNVVVLAAGGASVFHHFNLKDGAPR